MTIEKDPSIRKRTEVDINKSLPRWFVSTIRDEFSDTFKSFPKNLRYGVATIGMATVAGMTAGILTGVFALQIGIFENEAALFGLAAAALATVGIIGARGRQRFR